MTDGHSAEEDHIGMHLHSPLILLCESFYQKSWERYWTVILINSCLRNMKLWRFCILCYLLYLSCYDVLDLCFYSPILFFIFLILHICICVFYSSDPLYFSYFVVLNVYLYSPTLSILMLRLYASFCGAFVFIIFFVFCICILNFCLLYFWNFDVEFIRIMSRKLPSSREEGEVSLICSTKTQDLILLVFKYFQLKFCMEKKSWDTAFKDLMMKIVWTCFENDE